MVNGLNRLGYSILFASAEPPVMLDPDVSFVREILQDHLACCMNLIIISSVYFYAFSSSENLDGLSFIISAFSCKL